MPRIYLKNFLQYQLGILVAFFFTAVVMVSFSMAALWQNITADDLITISPVFVFCLGLFLIFMVLIAFSRTRENNRIQAIINDNWIVCDQVDNPHVWQTSAIAYWQRYRASHPFPKWQILTLTVIMAGMTIYMFITTRQYDPGATSQILIMIPIYFIFVGVVLGWNYLIFWKFQRLHRHHQSLDIPRIYIGPKGIYSELTGYQNLKELAYAKMVKAPSPQVDYYTQSYKYMHPQEALGFAELDAHILKRGWGLLELKFLRKVRAGRHGTYEYPFYLYVRIPPHQRQDIKDVVRDLNKIAPPRKSPTAGMPYMK